MCVLELLVRMKTRRAQKKGDCDLKGHSEKVDLQAGRLHIAHRGDSVLTQPSVSREMAEKFVDDQVSDTLNAKQSVEAHQGWMQMTKQTTGVKFLVLRVSKRLNNSPALGLGLRGGFQKVDS